VAANTKPLRDRGPVLSATQASEKIAAGRPTSLAVVEDCLARIAARELSLGVYRSGSGQKEGVAIGWCMHDRLGPDIGARAPADSQHELLT
jgi:hypothetical protein